MKRRKARSVDRADFDRGSLILRADAVRLIAEEIAQAPNRVSHRIGYAVAKGVLRTETQGRFRYGTLIAWAQDTWPGNFEDWPIIRHHVATPGTGTARLAPLTASGVGRVSPPDTLEGWRSFATRLQAEHEKLAQESYSLRQENDRLRREVEQLRPFRDADQRKRRDSSEYGKRARGIPKKREK